MLAYGGIDFVAKSCLTLCNPMDCSPPASSFHGISQARILEWVAISFSTAYLIIWSENQIRLSNRQKYLRTSL